jgi:hypothetical protein
LEGELRQLLEAPKPEPPATPALIRCFDCGRPARGEDHCPYCGASRGAPSCPSCGRPVSPARNQDVASYQIPTWTGVYDQYAWNAHWDGCCTECGFEFQATLQIRTGHDSWIGLPDPEFETEKYCDALSIVRIRGAESEHLDYDMRGRVPVIEVSVKRAEAGSDERGLPRESTIMMTLEEWQTVFEQLQGPLKPLIERRGWTREATTRPRSE